MIRDFTDLIRFKNEIEQMSDVIALSIIKHTSPREDEMTSREAHKFAGHRWLERQIREGNISGRRIGPAKNSPIVFSRREIAALMESERVYKVEVTWNIDNNKPKNKTA